MALPTLSGLVEACRWGENEFLLGGKDNKWDAQSYNKAKRTFGEGTTPEEAVARLWLALNKK